MVEPSNSGDSERTMIVLGALGAGKSTFLNILNSQDSRPGRKEFVASNSLKGFTKDFPADVLAVNGYGPVKLIDSPGLADPNIPIDQWVNLYNQQVKGEPIELVVCLIEYAERPSTKELQVFALMNQALASIKPENLVVCFNKAPEQFDEDDAKDFYDECRSSLEESTLKLPDLEADRFKVYYRKGKIKKQMAGEELKKAQKEVTDLLSKEVCGFLFPRLVKVKVNIVAEKADRKIIAAAITDEETKKDLAAQEKRYDENRELFEKELAAARIRHEELSKLVRELQIQLNGRLSEIKEAPKPWWTAFSDEAIEGYVRSAGNAISEGAGIVKYTVGAVVGSAFDKIKNLF